MSQGKLRRERQTCDSVITASRNGGAGEQTEVSDMADKNNKKIISIGIVLNPESVVSPIPWTRWDFCFPILICVGKLCNFWARHKDKLASHPFFLYLTALDSVISRSWVTRQWIYVHLNHNMWLASHSFPSPPPVGCGICNLGIHIKSVNIHEVTSLYVLASYLMTINYSVHIFWD